MILLIILCLNAAGNLDWRVIPVSSMEVCMEALPKVALTQPDTARLQCTYLPTKNDI